MSMSTITTSFLSFLSLTSRHKSKSVPKSSDVSQRTRSKGSPAVQPFVRNQFVQSFVFLSACASVLPERSMIACNWSMFITSGPCCVLRDHHRQSNQPLLYFGTNVDWLMMRWPTRWWVGGWSGNDDCLGAGLGAGGGYSSGYTG